MGRACTFLYVSLRGLVTNVACSKYQCNPCTSSKIITLEQLVGVLKIISIQIALYLSREE